jgi:hypothetical protein
MSFLKDIIIPLVVAAIAVGFLSNLVNFVLRLIRLDVLVLKLILFFGAWYFIGPLIYNFLLNTIIAHENDVISFFYQPVQIIMSILKV